MTIILFGAEFCNACNQAKTLLGESPIDWAYKDVLQIPSYLGDIPMLQFEDGTQIIGLGPINQFIQQWKKENGFL